MDHTTNEPTLEELLADPIVQLMMKCDNVLAGDVRRVFHKARERHASREPSVEQYSGYDTLNGGPTRDEGVR